jgi:hypothetical protein
MELRLLQKRQLEVLATRLIRKVLNVAHMQNGLMKLVLAV